MQTIISDPVPADTSQSGKVVCVGSWFVEEGKTVITTLLAMALMHSGRRVVVLDLGGNARNVAFLFNSWPVLNLGHLLTGETGLEEVIVHVPEAIDLIATSPAGAQSSMSGDKVARLLGLLQELETQYDYLFVDCPAGAPDWLRPLWNYAHGMITVVSAASLGYGANWSMEGQRSTSHALRGLVINKADTQFVLPMPANLRGRHLLASGDGAPEPVLLGAIHWSGTISGVMEQGTSLQWEAVDTLLMADIAAMTDQLVASFNAEMAARDGPIVTVNAANPDTLSASTPDQEVVDPFSQALALLEKYRQTFEAAGQFPQHWTEQLCALIETYSKAVHRQPLETMVQLSLGFDAHSEPGTFITDMVLALEQEYHARFHRPVRWADEDALQELFSEGFSEAALLRINRQLQSSYRARFNRDLMDPIAEIVAQIRGPSYTKPRFFALQHKLMQAFAQRFGTHFADTVGKRAKSHDPAEATHPKAIVVTATDIVVERARLLEQRNLAPTIGGDDPKQNDPQWSRPPIQAIPLRGAEAVLAFMAIVLVCVAIGFRLNDKETKQPEVAAIWSPPVSKSEEVQPPVEANAPSVPPVIVQQPPTEAPPEPATEAANEEPNATSYPDVATTDADVTVPEPVAQPTSVDTVAVEALEECWITVRDADGRKIGYELLKPGMTAIYRGKLPFRVTLGNSRGVKISVNGEPFDLVPYQRYVVAHLTLGSSASPTIRPDSSGIMRWQRFASS